jgi:putative addiction module killer protein
VRYLSAVTLSVLEYATDDGHSPFRTWLESLGAATKARVQARVFRFELGNLGDHKSVGGGVWEARLQFGPGYRIYFAKDGTTIILLLTGGDKATQRKDIDRARIYWARYCEEAKDGEAQ